MNTVEKIKAELKAQKIPVSRMERDLGFANGYISQLKKGTVPAGRLQAIAEYLGKPFIELLGDGVIRTVTTEEERQALEEHQKIIEERNKEESEAESMIRDRQILKDRPDLRALLYVSSRNTPEQVRKLTALMESMNEG